MAKEDSEDLLGNNNGKVMRLEIQINVESK